MTRTINSDSYAVLLVKYQPKVIETEAENEAAIALAEELEHKRLRTPEEDTLLELLVILIEKFEQEHYPLPEANPHSMLLHLMDAQNTKEEDLVGVIGADKDVVCQVVNGKRDIEKNWAKALGEFFHVSPKLFT
jgi:HTH-type transcriptional regulator / antitoxin HigA